MSMGMGMDMFMKEGFIIVSRNSAIKTDNTDSIYPSVDSFRRSCTLPASAPATHH